MATGGNSNGETSHMASNVTTDDVTTTGFDLTISDDETGLTILDDVSFSVTC